MLPLESTVIILLSVRSFRGKRGKGMEGNASENFKALIVYYAPPTHTLSRIAQHSGYGIVKWNFCLICDSNVDFGAHKSISETFV